MIYTNILSISDFTQNRKHIRMKIRTTKNYHNTHDAITEVTTPPPARARHLQINLNYCETKETSVPSKTMQNIPLAVCVNLSITYSSH